MNLARTVGCSWHGTSRSRSWPLLLALISGALFSLQSFIGGRLAAELESAQWASLLGLVVAAVTAWSVVLVSGAGARGVRRLREGARIPFSDASASALAAPQFLVLTSAAPKLGIALLTVGLVSGQVVGGLVIDRLGLSPAGRIHLTVARMLAAMLAISAVGLVVFENDQPVHAGLLFLTILAGVVLVVLQTCVSRVGRAIGEPLMAQGINYTVALFTLAVVMVVSDLSPPDLSAPPQLWLAGAVGFLGTALAVRVITVLGALRMTLTFVLGQSVAGIVTDVLAPARAQPISLRTVVSVTLVVVAITLSGRARASDSSGLEPSGVPGSEPDAASSYDARQQVRRRLRR
jgi:transporter family-2 protein